MTNKTGTSGVLAALAALSLAACTPGSGGGTTTIIQQPPAANNAPTTSTTPSVTPISDGKKLCHLAVSRAKEIAGATDPYWNLVQAPGWSWSDSKVNDAADKVAEISSKTIPILKGIVASDAPQDIANAVHKYTDAAEKFTKAVSDRDDDQTIDSTAKEYQSGIDGLEQACKK